MLKRILASAATLGLLALPLAAQANQQANAGNKVTITGEVVDVNCYSTHQLRGAQHKACATACAKAGVALAILGSDGTLYMPVSAKPGDPQNPRLMQFIAEQVKVTGTHRSVSGLHTIEIETVQAAS